MQKSIKNELAQSLSAIDTLDHKLIKLNFRLKLTKSFADECRDAWSNQDLDSLLAAREKLQKSWPEKMAVPKA